ncbi:hypothetical protein [Corynebacterium mastitidis]|uniref:hypothetical protein n=1 Tax=Corynebacterium mastitidis TaxID=161890 RepID=UPI0003A8F0D6|nr:hypothetical protein [Corynebacterium mastitidis]
MNHEARLPLHDTYGDINATITTILDTMAKEAKTAMNREGASLGERSENLGRWSALQHARKEINEFLREKQEELLTEKDGSNQWLI